MHHISLPRVGMRVTKTVIAAFLCAMLGYLRGQVPFYSMIAAILCLQKDLGQSGKVARNRIIGTLLGGLFGFLALIFVKYTHMTAHTPLYYFFICLCLLPLIYLTVLIEKKPASYITCVVFLSITVSHISDEVPALFVVHRVLDTLIGIVVSLLVNRLLPGSKDSTPDKAEP